MDRSHGVDRAVPCSDELKFRIAESAPDVRRKAAWEYVIETERRARDAGCAGVILMGLRFDSVVEEAPQFLLEHD